MKTPKKNKGELKKNPFHFQEFNGDEERLELKNKKLMIIPQGVFKLEGLTWLSLSQNLLDELTPEIGTLVNLKTLRLFGNYLSILPPEIGKLENLTILDLGNQALFIFIFEKKNLL
jgi:Leucine-rich repeat (LRR) protein